MTAHWQKADWALFYFYCAALVFCSFLLGRAFERDLGGRSGTAPVTSRE